MGTEIYRIGESRRAKEQESKRAGNSKTENQKFQRRRTSFLLFRFSAFLIFCPPPPDSIL